MKISVKKSLIGQEQRKRTTLLLKKDGILTIERGVRPAAKIQKIKKAKRKHLPNQQKRRCSRLLYA